MVHIKFYAKEMRSVGEILNYLAKLQYKASNFCIVVMSQFFIVKLKTIETKVSIEDFYLLDLGKVPNLIQTILEYSNV